MNAVAAFQRFIISSAKIRRPVKALIICSFHRGEYSLKVGKRSYRFEDNAACGPIPLDDRGKMKADTDVQFWTVVSRWYQQGKKANKFGQCLFPDITSEELTNIRKTLDQCAAQNKKTGAVKLLKTLYLVTQSEAQALAKQYFN